MAASAMCKKRLRENNPNWLGGVTPFLERLRTSLIYRKWRRAIIARDKVCLKCGGSEQLEADHIRQFSILLHENKITTQEQAEACGQTLCHACHKLTDTYANRKFRKLVNIDQFDESKVP